MAKLRHVSLHTPDPEKTAEFYKRVFDAIDADLICLSSHLTVTTKAGAADGMASRVASPTKIAA